LWNPHAQNVEGKEYKIVLQFFKQQFALMGGMSQQKKFAPDEEWDARSLLLSSDQLTEEPFPAKKSAKDNLDVSTDRWHKG
jgi:hypothetical protein